MRKYVNCYRFQFYRKIKFFDRLGVYNISSLPPVTVTSLLVFVSKAKEAIRVLVINKTLLLAIRLQLISFFRSINHANLGFHSSSFR